MARKAHERKSSPTGTGPSAPDDNKVTSLLDPSLGLDGANAPASADVASLTSVSSSSDRSSVGKLRREVEQLKHLVGHLAAVNSMESVMINGFSQLSTQLQPLRSLEPTRGELPPDAIARLRDLRAALKRPQWRGSDFEIHEDLEEKDPDTI